MEIDAAFLSTLNFEEKCRLCMNGQNLLSLETNPTTTEINYKQMLEYFTTVRVKSHEQLPNKLCQICASEVARCYNFKKKCEDVDETWHKIIANKTLLKNEQEEIDRHPDVIVISNGAQQQDSKAPSDPTIVESESKNVCSVCLQAYSTPQTLFRHKRTSKHLSNSMIECSVCSKHVRGSSYRSHVRTHDGVKPEQCQICSKRFSYKANLKRHVERHKDQRPYKCHLCKKCYTRNEQLKNHLKTHETGGALSPRKKTDPVSCTFCTQSFYFVGKLALHHDRYHAADNPDRRVCDVCGLLLDTSDMNDHIATMHANSKRWTCYKCEACDVTVHGYHRFRAHKMKHQGKSFTCSHCGKGFFREHHLRVHVRLHTGERPFACEHCDRTFSSKVNRRLHLVVHSGAAGATDRAYACESCGKIFSTAQSLYKHTLIHRGIKQYVCKVCNKAFTQTHQLKQHVRYHTGERPFVCSYCSKMFSISGNLKQHMRVHVKETPKHFCLICNKGFHEASALRKHVKIHGAIPQTS